MKPLNIDKTGCSNMSSNCVVWQGPDIECINLCKGDSVTEVVYKLALELCNLMNTFDLKNYDLKCFSSGVCQPQTFQDFINILITKICALQDCNPQCGDSCNPCPTPPVAFSTMAAGMTGSSDMYVPIAKEFQFKSSIGDDVTMLTVGDYAQAIGNKVSTLVNSASILQNTLSDHSARIAALESAPAPQFSMPTVTPVGVLPKEATSMQLVLAATEQQFTELKTALGDANSIYRNVQKIDPNINDLKSLSVPGSNVSSLKGFTMQPVSLSDVVGNMLVMIKDMRAAIVNITNNYIPSDCDAISIDLFATIKNNQLVFYFTGKLPKATFTNTNSMPTVVTVSDSHGSSINYSIDIFTVLNAPAGYSVELTDTRLITSDNLVITCNPSFTSKVNGSVCKSYITYTVVNEITLPFMTYTPYTDSVDFLFTSSDGTRAYTVELLDSTGQMLIGSQTLVSTTVRSYTGSFTGLTSRTLYKARIKTTKDNVEKLSEFSSITTL
jgi:hypothetical protein